MNAFRVGVWEHSAPEEHYDRDGKRAIIKHLCYGPLETMIYGVTTDSTYYWEYHIIEGLEEGERFLEYISKEKMLHAIDHEISLCEQYQALAMIPLFLREKEQIENH